MVDSVLDRTPPLADVRLTYGEAPEHFADLRLPAGEGPFPAIAYIHGGFWRSQYDLLHAGHICAALTAAGFATYNIEYRRIGNEGGGWPGTFQDVTAAIRHLFTIADEIGIDGERIGVAGHSAGGQLALWVGGFVRVTGESPIRSEPLPLRCAISLAGVVDLRQAWQLKLSDGVVETLLDGTPESVRERFDAASPMEIIPFGIPHLLIHGLQDEIVPAVLSTAFARASVAAGGECTLLELEGADHFAVIDPLSTVWPEIEAAIKARFGME